MLNCQKTRSCSFLQVQRREKERVRLTMLLKKSLDSRYSHEDMCCMKGIVMVFYLGLVTKQNLQICVLELEKEIMHSKFSIQHVIESQSEKKKSLLQNLSVDRVSLICKKECLKKSLNKVPFFFFFFTCFYCRVVP